MSTKAPVITHLGKQRAFFLQALELWHTSQCRQESLYSDEQGGQDPTQKVDSFHSRGHLSLVIISVAALAGGSESMSSGVKGLSFLLTAPNLTNYRTLIIQQSLHFPHL